MRIAVAGFQHETNTFARNRAGLAEFRMADSWPRMLLGEDVVGKTAGLNLPIAGAIAAAQTDPEIEIIPIIWCAAEPSGPVTDEAFDWVATQIIDAIQRASPLDGLFFDLHGAMVTESYDDGEGALLERLRGVFGSDLPISVSLDLHANISPSMARHATQISIFRTYPHLDMAQTGERALRALQKAIRSGAPRVAFRQASFLIPLHAQCTDLEPCRSLYALLEAEWIKPGETVELAMGFTAADIHDCGPSVLAYAASQTRADELAEAMLARLVEAEGAFDTTLLSSEDAVRLAMASQATKPVVLADVQDNPGAGATSDTTGLFRALIACDADQAVLGLMHDPVLAADAQAAGVGARLSAAIGGRSGVAGDRPIDAVFRVLALSDGRIPYLGEMYGGGVAEIGPSCLLKIDGVAGDIRVVVSSLRSQCLDRGFFTAFGLDLTRTRLICLKSTVHFRADFRPIADQVIAVAAPGLFPCTPQRSTYRKLRAGVRFGPKQREMSLD